ncbi:MAG: sodium:proton exchanger [Deltaproteobacteria bacterium]|jgi:cation:H+ antiporter|nr:sodium:proton exchanger [Deltaproteobacteria bacterium]
MTDFDRYDVISCVGVISFFLVCSLIFHGNIINSLVGATGIVLLMSVVSASITVLLNGLGNHPRVGEIAGYITNGPEALCMIVGLVHGKIIFAASVPLGSNFANPILLILASLICASFLQVVRTDWKRNWSIVLLSMSMALLFFWKSSQSFRIGWVIFSLVLSVILYRIKPDEQNQSDDDDDDDDAAAARKRWIIPAVTFIALAGYFLDPMVAFTAKNSLVPEGAIGFFVLSFLSSWPEFRGTVTLMRMNKVRSAIMNIAISNITNLWLAIAGIIIYLASS